MSLMQAIIVFAVGWWLVFLAVLPLGVKAIGANNEGHAPSAPISPNIRRKMRYATVGAGLITVFSYLLIGSAYAANSLLRARSGCESVIQHRPSEDIRATDDVTLPAHPMNQHLEQVTIPMEIPVTNYRESPSSNVDLSTTRIWPGAINVDTKQGEARFNGVDLAAPPTVSGDCSDEGSNNIMSTK